MAEGPFIRDLFMTGQQTNESLVNIAFGKLDFVNFKVRLVTTRQSDGKTEK